MCITEWLVVLVQLTYLELFSFFFFFQDNHCLLTLASEERSMQEQLFPYLRAKLPLWRLAGVCPTPTPSAAGCALRPSPGGDAVFSHPWPWLLRHSATALQQVRLDLTSARDCPSAAGPKKISAVTEKDFSQAKCDLFIGTEHYTRGEKR